MKPIFDSHTTEKNDEFLRRIYRKKICGNAWEIANWIALAVLVTTPIWLNALACLLKK